MEKFLLYYLIVFVFSLLSFWLKLSRLFNWMGRGKFSCKIHANIRYISGYISRQLWWGIFNNFTKLICSSHRFFFFCWPSLHISGTVTYGQVETFICYANCMSSINFVYKLCVCAMNWRSYYQIKSDIKVI